MGIKTLPRELWSHRYRAWEGEVYCVAQKISRPKHKGSFDFLCPKAGASVNAALPGPSAFPSNPEPSSSEKCIPITRHLADVSTATGLALEHKTNMVSDVSREIKAGELVQSPSLNSISLSSSSLYSVSSFDVLFRKDLWKQVFIINVKNHSEKHQDSLI